MIAERQLPPRRRRCVKPHSPHSADGSVVLVPDSHINRMTVPLSDRPDSIGTCH